MTKIVKVSRAKARAARLRVRSDKERGITPDPRMERIAAAVPVNGQAALHAIATMTAEAAVARATGSAS